MTVLECPCCKGKIEIKIPGLSVLSKVVETRCVSTEPEAPKSTIPPVVRGESAFTKVMDLPENIQKELRAVDERIMEEITIKSINEIRAEQAEESKTDEVPWKSMDDPEWIKEHTKDPEE